VVVAKTFTREKEERLSGLELGVGTHTGTLSVP